MGYAWVKAKGQAFGFMSFWRHVGRDISMLLLYQVYSRDTAQGTMCFLFEIAMVLMFDVISCSGRYAVQDDCIHHWCLLVFAHRAISKPCPCVIYPFE
jgi:hypothetical protein